MPRTDKSATLWLDRHFPLPFYFRLCLTPKEFSAELERLKAKERPLFVPDGASAVRHWLINEQKKPTFIVCLDYEKAKSRSWVEIAGLLIHEAVHIFQGYCEDIGERSPSAEFEAYTIQWISQQLLEAWSRQRPKSARGS